MDKDKLILKTLHEYFEKVRGKRVPFKSVGHSISIDNVQPCDLMAFMQMNNIPESAEFSFDEATEEPALYWTTERPMTDNELEEWRESVFNANAFTVVSRTLTEGGFKRIPTPVEHIKNFIGFNPYKAINERNRDMLVAYFGGRFTTQETLNN